MKNNSTEKHMLLKSHVHQDEFLSEIDSSLYKGDGFEHSQL